MLHFHWVDSFDVAGLIEVRKLFAEYQAELGVDLCFQQFAEELRFLPGAYSPPHGALLLARLGPDAIGCGAVKLHEAGIAEIKRVYVRPAFRGHGYGREIMEELVDRSRRLGYRRVRLDSLRRLVPAGELYRSMGFEEIDPYNENPEPDVVYMERSVEPEL